MIQADHAPVTLKRGIVFWLRGGHPKRQLYRIGTVTTLIANQILTADWLCTCACSPVRKFATDFSAPAAG